MFCYREVKHFIIWFYPPMMDYDVYLHNLVVLFVASSTSPRSSKTESGGKIYHTFSIDSFLKTGRPAWPTPGRVSCPQAGRFGWGASLRPAWPGLGRDSCTGDSSPNGQILGGPIYGGLLPHWSPTLEQVFPHHC